MQGTDSDGSTVSDNEQRQAAMLLIGPVGSGKTSLVYTAAQVTNRISTSYVIPVAHPPCGGAARKSAQDLESYEACTRWRQHVCYLQPADSALSLNMKPIFAEPLNVSPALAGFPKHSSFIHSML